MNTRKEKWLYQDDQGRTKSLTYKLWFKDTELIEIRNILSKEEFGYTVDKNSEIYQYFTSKYQI